MAAATPRGVARRSLIWFLVLLVGLGALLGSAHQWSTAQLSPKLGLDLEGGTQMVLEPQTNGSQAVTPDLITQARDIISQRVDASGFSGAEVATLGDTNIVVSVPGVVDEATKNAIEKSSAMQFRPVLVATAGIVLPTPSASGSVSPSGSSSTTGSAPAASSKASPTKSTSASPSATPKATSSASPSPSPSASSATPTDPTSEEWVTQALADQLQALDCSKADALDGLVDDIKKPLVTCSTDRTEKYILGPVVVAGDQIEDASAGYSTNSQGVTTSTVAINLTFKSTGAQAYADISRTMVSLADPRNRLAATLDSRVIVAPRFNSVIPDGRAEITGGFTLAEAQALAKSLKFGALPLSFKLQTSTDISPLLGKEQLRFGLIAGLVGLLVVFLYSLLQYRVLGLVTIASIVVAAALTYLVVTILGWSHNLRLDMAGVTGLIVAIGFTADSFIVYFERIRDELREGRSLASAVETGWARAKRTILAADGVNFLAAAVLYVLASSSVRGFAFTLGLTTLIDLVVVFLFTHPMVSLLSHRPFFRDGHPSSGLDPRRLGASTTSYAGRGRFVSRPTAVAGAEGGAR